MQEVRNRITFFTLLHSLYCGTSGHTLKTFQFFVIKSSAVNTVAKYLGSIKIVNQLEAKIEIKTL